MNENRLERTEQNDREGLDIGSKFKGIAQHPFARRWLRLTLRDARQTGDKLLEEKTRLCMRRYGMEVR